ncbi:hypothetical protein K435DRAFT_839558 [Dendrothele bispora CBS 962.96]|uniref:Uncharacterized protein n=1 Tax=Dendrothele bispora (strain CBS 962.96) TaxID=1314807 RepID=A0A4S8LZY2_DENBC|nr:hypothetical protein K435DRAFT_839558 [Dendrothele bispora CBS 962.96]
MEGPADAEKEGPATGAEKPATGVETEGPATGVEMEGPATGVETERPATGVETEGSAETEWLACALTEGPTGTEMEGLAGAEPEGPSEMEVGLACVDVERPGTELATRGLSTDARLAVSGLFGFEPVGSTDIGSTFGLRVFRRRSIISVTIVAAPSCGYPGLVHSLGNEPCVNRNTRMFQRRQGRLRGGKKLEKTIEEDWVLPSWSAVINQFGQRDDTVQNKF